MCTVPIDAAMIRQSPLFAELPEQALTRIEQAAWQIELPARGFLFRQGDAGGTAFVVVSGRLRLIQHTISGHDVALDIYGPGELITPSAATLAAERHTASCEALNAAVVFALPMESLFVSMTASPGLMRRVFGGVLTQLRDAQDHARELAAETAERRIARAVIRMASKTGVPDGGNIRIDVPITRQAIAELSGTTLHTASRVLSDWHRAKWVYAGRETLTLLLPRALHDIAEGHAPSLR